MTRFSALLCSTALLTAGPVWAATVSPANLAGLWPAVRASSPGDVVLLPGGSYPTLDLSNVKFAAPGITLKPAPGAKVIVGQAIFSNSQGMTLSGVEITQPVSSWMSALYVAGASRMNFDGLHIHHADGSMGGTGAIIRDSSDVTLTNSEVDHIGLAIAAIDSQRITLRGNRIHDLSGDAIDVAGSGNSLIDGNSDTDHYPTEGSHPDFIQFWGTAGNPTPANNVVTGNVYRRGKGAVAQGVFIENQANITISGNAMSGTMGNGISLSAVKTASVTGNFVQGWADMASWITARGGSSNLTITGNFSSGGVSIVPKSASEAATTGVVQGGNTAIPRAAVGDTSALTAWLAAKNHHPVPPAS
jgi:hypothetical protein